MILLPTHTRCRRIAVAQLIDFYVIPLQSINTMRCHTKRNLLFPYIYPVIVDLSVIIFRRIYYTYFFISHHKKRVFLPCKSLRGENHNVVLFPMLK